MNLLRTTLTLCVLMAALVYGVPVEKKQIQTQKNGKLVFAHFIVGIVGNRASAADWDADMKRAKAYGIDAFALNIGTDPFTDTQLKYAYASAANNGMKVFLSFDFAWWSINNSTGVGQKVAAYANNPGQLNVDGKTFVSSFVGDGLNVNAVRQAAGTSLYFAPNFSPNAVSSQLASLDAAFSWEAWPNNGANRAPPQYSLDPVTSDDATYTNVLGQKDYVAPVSPWFFTHYGPEVSYRKNWIFPSDLLWYQRWQQLLTSNSRFIEIITWNDYGESHYVGPLSSPHYDDGASKWVNDMPHDGWLDMAKPFIAAYKAGAGSVNNYITTDQLIYWYRPQLKGENCQATDNAGAAPDGWNTTPDQIFVTALLTSAATVQVTSGNNKAVSYSAQAGASIFSVPMGVGQQKFSIVRGSQTVLSDTSAKNIIDGCVCGLYNFNAYVGTLPASNVGSLSGHGFDGFTNGLKVTTCKPTPSLGSTSGAAAPTTTSATQVTHTTIQSSTISAPAATVTSSTSTSTCNKGTGPGNYIGLCDFTCSRGYCPSPCTCTGNGAPITQPTPQSNIRGVPADGLDQSYAGLCNFTCQRGYCPSGACKLG